MAALDLRAFDIDSDVAFALPEGAPRDPSAPPSLHTDDEETHTVGAMAAAKAAAMAASKAKPPRAARPMWPWLAGVVVLVLVVGGVGLRFLRPSPTPAATPPPPAGLRIETEPAGATVSIDGKELGVSPLTVPNVTPGLRTVRVFRDGYAPTELSLEVAPEVALAPLRFSLQAVDSKAAVTSEPAGAAVALDGRDAGKTPLDGVRLTPGPHDVLVQAPGYHP
jgi:hypothetical protein